jgi:hypothetical protein
VRTLSITRTLGGILCALALAHWRQAHELSGIHQGLAASRRVFASRVAQGH